MKKAVLTLATAIATATLTVAPQPAHAQWWIAPAIVGGVILGVGVGAAAATTYNGDHAYAPLYAYPREPGYVEVPGYAYASGYAYVPAGYVYAPNVVYVQRRCYYTRALANGYWRRIRACN